MLCANRESLHLNAMRNTVFCAEQTAGVKEAITFSLGKAAADSSRRLPSVPDERHIFTLLLISLANGSTLHRRRQLAGSGVRISFSSFACRQEVIFQKMQPALVAHSSQK